MTTRKRDPTIGRRYSRNSLLFGLPFLAALAFAFYAHHHGRTDWFIAACVVGLGIGLTGFVRQQRLFQRYSCPDCDRRLENPSRRPREPVEYSCPGRDVIWETGLFEPQD